MVRFKQFEGRGADLERAVNTWLAEYEPDVNEMVQTVGADGAVTLSLLYDESFRGQERRIASETGMSDAVDVPVPESVMQDTPLTVPQEPGQYTSDTGLT